MYQSWLGHPLTSLKGSKQSCNHFVKNQPAQLFLIALLFHVLLIDAYGFNPEEVNVVDQSPIPPLVIGQVYRLDYIQ